MTKCCHWTLVIGQSNKPITARVSGFLTNQQIFTIVVSSPPTVPGPSDCPLAGKCQKESVIYQATVTTEDNKPDKTYIGLTENTFKTRFTNHKASFNHKTKRLNTELSKHIWQLKESNTRFKITWKILKQASPYNPASSRCSTKPPSEKLWRKQSG